MEHQTCVLELEREVLHCLLSASAGDQALRLVKVAASSDCPELLTQTHGLIFACRWSRQIRYLSN